jgi:hypothetical protein
LKKPQNYHFFNHPGLKKVVSLRPVSTALYSKTNGFEAIILVPFIHTRFSSSSFHVCFGLRLQTGEHYSWRKCQWTTTISLFYETAGPVQQQPHFGRVQLRSFSGKRRKYDGGTFLLPLLLLLRNRHRCCEHVRFGWKKMKMNPGGLLLLLCDIVGQQQEGKRWKKKGDIGASFLVCSSSILSFQFIYVFIRRNECFLALELAATIRCRGATVVAQPLSHVRSLKNKRAAKKKKHMARR